MLYRLRGRRRGRYYPGGGGWGLVVGGVDFELGLLFRGPVSYFALWRILAGTSCAAIKGETFFVVQANTLPEHTDSNFTRKQTA